MADFTSAPLLPNPDHPDLSTVVDGLDHFGQPISTAVITEQPLTLFLNSREIVTLMTVGDYPQQLAVGFLRNQTMLRDDDQITAIDHDRETQTIIVRTHRETDYETKLKKKIQTSGCAQGTLFGDIIESLAPLPDDRQSILKTSDLYQLTRQINQIPSLYLKAGAIHGCVLCCGSKILIYMEDVGRHNAVDKIAGTMFLSDLNAEDKIFYTTGRLTSEMILKCTQMRIPILISRSGFTAWGVELAARANLTLIGRARGRRFITLAGSQRIVYDANPIRDADDEPRHHRRKAATDKDRD